MKFVEHKRVPLVAPKPVMKMIDAQCIELRHVKGMDDSDLNSFFQVEYGTHFASFFPVDHGIKGFPSYGIKVIFDGVQVVFSGDTVKPLSAELIRESHRVFHDVTFREPDGTEVHCPLVVLEEFLKDNLISPARIIAVHHGKLPSTGSYKLGNIMLGFAGDMFLFGKS